MGLTDTFAEITEEKMVGGGAFCPHPPSWIGLRTMYPLAKPRSGSNQATKINLFVRIVDAFKLMS